VVEILSIILLGSSTLLNAKLLFLATEGQGKWFTQAKYEAQVLRGELRDICTRLHEKQLGEFCCDKDYFIVENRNRVHGKKNTWKNQGLCKKAWIKYYILAID
jgi:hypothetical protein